MDTRPIKEKLDQRIHDHELEPLPNRAHEITRGVMRQNEEMYRDILESIEEGYFELDLNGTFTFVNNAACALMGYEYDELIGMNYKIYTTPETARHMYKVFHQIFETGKRETMVDYEVISKKGFVRIHEMNASLLRDTSGQPMGFRVMVWDLTESKREEDVIRKREERYRNILESMAEAYFEVDLKGNLTFFNSTATKGLGYTNEEMMGMNFHQFVDDENARKVFDAYHKVFLTGETIKAFEWEFINKHGEKMAVESSVSLRRDENGSTIGFRGVVRDISDRKKAEAAQRESEEKYRSILENIEEGYYEVDLNGNFTFFNDSMRRMIGYNREEMMGMNYSQFMDKEYKLKVYNIFHDVFLTGKADKGFDWEIVGNDGSRRHIESSVVLIRNSNGKPVGFRGIVHDITDRKRAEEALRQSEGRLKTILETIQEGIVMIDPETHQIADANSIAVNMIGKTREEIIGSACHKFICPAEKGKCPITDLRQEVDHSERVLLKSGGERCPIIKTVTSIILDGKTYLFESFIDISERKRAEEENKRLEEQLVRAQKMEAIGTLAGGIAHDFNNLLTGILGNISIMRMNFDDSHPFFDRLTHMEEYVQRGSDLTKQLLGFAQGGKYEIKPTYLGEFIRRSSEMFGRTKKEIRIHHKVPEALWPVEVDRGQMEQVLLNLYVNAWQAMPGGGDLYLSVENVDLDETDVSPFGVKPGKYVKMTITDTGVGMDEATKVRIFEPFFTTKERGRGTGLGLASVYGIIKNHGGFINVESEKHMGTSFLIFLPASDKNVVHEYRVKEAIQKGQETVLFIDDEDMVLDVGSEMIKGLGYEVMTATGGKPGLEIYELNRDKIDLVILDMIMPDFSGKDTFDALQRINPSVRVLLSSGYSLDGPAKEIMGNGCRGFIQKPFTMSELSNKIRGILDE